MSRSISPTDFADLDSAGLETDEIAHDLKNLLASIGLFAELGQALPSDGSPSRGMFEQIQGACRDAGELANTLVSPGNCTGNQRQRECFDLSTLVDDATPLLAASVNGATQLRVERSADPAVVTANPFCVRRVLMNLVLNASQALEGRSGLVVVSTGTCDLGASSFETIVAGDLVDGNYPFFEVTDSGYGMDVVTQAQLFEPRFTTRPTGHGLGMSSAQRIVIAHGGAIQVQSRPGAGTSVRVLLPPAEPQETDLEACCDRPVDESRIVEWEPVGTVLLVDDDRSIRMMSEVMLESRGWSVLTAASGEEAVKVLQRHRGQVSVVVLDMLLSGMDGSATLREIRQIDSDMPVIVLSGSSQQELMNRFDNESPHAFLSKPFSVDDLVDVISDAIADAPASRDCLEELCHQIRHEPGEFNDLTL